MSIAKIYSRALTGMNAPQIIVEVHVASGLPSFSIVGLPDTEIKESRDRIRSAIQNSGFDFPARRITVNLAPADLPKDSSRYDLPIALGIIIAAKLITPLKDINQYEFAGELALDGELRPVKGALAMAFGIHNENRTFVLPIQSANEACLIEDIKIAAAGSLNQTLDFLLDKIELLHHNNSLVNHSEIIQHNQLNLSQVKGQLAAKKALEIAAAGRHSLLMVGNPGCGKSMLAERFITLLPKLSNKQAIQSASLHSISNIGFDPSTWQIPPFRAPHHSSSAVALVGGGSNPKPGEISLAHNGVLFLDELPEFDRRVLEVMREPLESKKIRLARANCKVDYMADFQLIAAMNPCPCGNHGHPQKNCSCSIEQINRYRSKISAPLLDRIDIVLEIPTLKPNELQELNNGEDSAKILERVNQAREIQISRSNKLNYELTNQELEEVCQLDTKSNAILSQLVEKNGLSARGYYRLLKLSRTIADLDTSKEVQIKHISQANQYKKII
jgi:magnesium chelatase family protein